MISKYRKFIYLALGIMLFTIPDIIFAVLAELTHLLFEVFHLLFEIVEVALDHLIEHLFHTELHQTQVIVFYILFTIGLYCAYRLWRVGKKCYYRLKNYLFELIVSYRAKLATVSFLHIPISHRNRALR